MNYKRGDIVYAKIKFINTNEERTRLLLIVNENTALEIYDSYNLTTQKHQHLNYNVLLEKNSQNMLNSDSYVKLDTVYEIDDSVILKKIGNESVEYLNFLNDVQTSLLKNKLLKEVKRQPLYDNQLVNEDEELEL